MKTETLGLIAWIFGVLFAMMIALAHPCEKWEAFDRAVQVTIAIGTLGTVVIALWIAGRQSREARAAALDRAYLVASGIADPLEIAYKLLSGHTKPKVYTNFGPRGQVIYPSARDDLRWLYELKRDLKNSVFDIDEERILILSPLPKHCATRLNAALTEIKKIRNRLDRLPEDGQNSAKSATELADFVAPKVEWCVHMLTVPVQVIVQIGIDYAPYPSDDERYAAMADTPRLESRSRTLWWIG